MHRVGDEIEKRRDELAHVLTLDQGKPLHESRDEVEELVAYWRNAAEDGKRLEGRLANSFTPGKRVLLVRRPRGVIGVITPVELAVHDARGADRAGARVRQHGRLDARVDDCRVRDARSPSASSRPTCRPASSTSSPARARPSATRSRATPARTASASSARPRPAARSPRRPPGKAAVLELGGNGPVVVMDDADLELAAEAAVTACFLCAGQSCTAGERLLVHRAVREEFVALLREKAQRVVLGDPFAETTTMGPLNNEGVAEKMDEHVADALERGAQVVHGGERADGFPTRLYWQADRARRRPARTRASRPRRRSGRLRRSSRSRRSTRRSGSRTRRRTACCRRSSRATSPPGLRYADEVKTGWVNINDSSNYWEAHLPFGGRSGTASGIGRVGGTAPMESFTELQTVVVGVTLRLRDRRRRLGGLRARRPADRRRRRRACSCSRPAARTRGGTSTSTCRRRSRSRSAAASTTGSTSRSRSRIMNGRRIYHARGKVLGGSSSINGMIFQRGNALDYERWAHEGGLADWDYAHCLPYFKRMETCVAGADEWRGGDGPLILERGPARRAALRRVLRRRAGSGLLAHRRRERLPPGGVREVRPQHLARPPLVGRARVPASGDEAAEPRGADADVRRADRLRGHARGRRRRSAGGRSAPTR